MRRYCASLIVVTLASAIGASGIGAQRAPAAATRVDARAALEASAGAIGGLEKLRELGGVRVTEVGTEYLVSTLTREDAPARVIAQSTTTLRSGRDSILRRTLTQTFPMRGGSFPATTIANRGAVAVARGTDLVAAGRFDVATTMEDLALAPERVLLTALDAPDLRVAPDTSIVGVPHRVVTFTWERAPVRLFIDRSSEFPTRVELTRAYPTNVFWAMWGDLRFVTEWSAWSLESGGVWYPRQRTVTLNGAPFREHVVTSLELNATVPPDSVAIPDSVRVASLWSGTRPQGAGVVPRLNAVVLADNVVLYEGGYQAAAVRQPDGVVVIEGPESNAKTRAVLADVATRWPGVRVKAVVTTSPMWMHIGGLREYAARRVPIYVLDVNAGVVRALIAARHRQAPDSLERARVAPVLRVVSSPVTLGSGAERIELRPARGQHSSAMMLAWMPALRLLYASDVVVPDAFEPVFASGYRAELARIVEREGLAVDRVFAEHLPAAAWASVVR